jgi:RHS repeat-associated protein
VITDEKRMILDGNNYSHYESVVVSVTDYSPFGVSLTGRTFTTTEGYRYGFNGKEEDKEGMGGGKQTYDYGFRIYNPALAKFLSVDPLSASYPWYTPYQFAGNKPIWAIDLDGKEEWYVTITINDDKSTTVLIVRNYDVGFSFEGDIAPGTGEVIRGSRPEKFQIVVNGEVSYSNEYTGVGADFVNEMVKKGEASTAASRLSKKIWEHRASKNIEIAPPPVKKTNPRNNSLKPKTVKSGPVTTDKVETPRVELPNPPPPPPPPPTSTAGIGDALCFGCWWGVANNASHWDKGLTLTIKWLDANPDYKLLIISNANAFWDSSWSAEEEQKLQERLGVFIEKIEKKSNGKYGKNDFQVKKADTATGSDVNFQAVKR